MAWRIHMKKLALFAILSLISQTAYSPVFAQNAALGEKAENSLEALKKAGQYSFDNAAIGILIAYGSSNGEGVTPQVIGDQFIKELQKRGYKARYFYYEESKIRGMVMEYHIGYAALGPWSVDEAASKITEATEMMDAALNVHGDWKPNSDQKSD
jgi:hypothetical protein